MSEIHLHIADRRLAVLSQLDEQIRRLQTKGSRLESMLGVIEENAGYALGAVAQ